MRIIVERQLDLEPDPRISAARCLALPIHGKDQESLVKEIYEFLLERLRAYYLEAGIRADVFEAVRARNPAKPLDFQRRVQAVNAFLACRKRRASQPPTSASPTSCARRR